MARTKRKATDEIEPSQGKGKGKKHTGTTSEKFIQEFSTRKFLIGRNTDFSFVSANIPIVNEWITRLKLKPIFCIEEYAYPNLIRLFFCNLKTDCVDDKFIVKSTVKGIPILLDCNLLGDILGIPHGGTQYYSTSSEWPKDIPVFDPENALKLILNTDRVKSLVGAAVETNMLRLDMKFLHRMICQIIVPRSGKFNNVTRMETLILWHIVTGTPINIPFLLLKHMAEAVTKGRILPYGTVLTKVFKHFKVPLAKEQIQKLKPFNIINQTTVARMQYVKKGGEWVHQPKKNEKGQEVEGEEGLNTDEEVDRTAEEAARDDLASSGQAPSMMDLQLMDLLLSLHMKIDDLQLQFNTRMDGFDTRMDGFETRMTEMYSLIHLHRSPAPPPPPPPPSNS